MKLLVEHDKELDINQLSNVLLYLDFVLISKTFLVVQACWSAIMLAVKNGHEELVRYLVEQGCDVQYQREKVE